MPSIAQRLQGPLIIHEIKTKVLSMDTKALQCLASTSPFSLILNLSPPSAAYGPQGSCYHTSTAHHRAFVQIV